MTVNGFTPSLLVFLCMSTRCNCSHDFSLFCTLLTTCRTLRICVSTRLTREANFSVHHLGQCFSNQGGGRPCDPFLDPYLMSISFFSTFCVFDLCIRIFQQHWSEDQSQQAGCITWHCFSNQGGGCSCDPFLVPCFVEPALFDNSCLSCY